MKILTHAYAIGEGVRVELAFEPGTETEAGEPLAVLDYHDPAEALEDACRFVETALSAVRAAARAAA